MSLLIFYHCISAFLFCQCSFNPSLCHLLPFLLPYVTVSRPCGLLKFTLTGSQRRNKVLKKESLCIVFSLTEKGPQAFPPTKYSYNHRQKCWEGCFFTSFFPCPRPNVEQNVNVCARSNCSVSLNRGEGGYLATEETLFF